jgi:hypothetical protein
MKFCGEVHNIMKNISTKNHFKRRKSRKPAWLVIQTSLVGFCCFQSNPLEKIEINSNTLQKIWNFAHTLTNPFRGCPQKIK